MAFKVVNHGISQIKTIQPRFPFASIPEFQKVLLIDEIFKRQSIDTNTDKVFFEQEHPADGEEFVQWMHEATAANSVLSGIQADFEDIGALVGTFANDPRQPGGGTPRMRWQRSYRNGGVIVASGESFSVPGRGGGSIEIMTKDVIGWAAILWAGRIQWVAAALEYLKLAVGRFSDKNVRFGIFAGSPVMSGFKISSRMPVKPPAVNIVFTTVSDKDATYIIEGRNISNFKELLFTNEIDIPAGENDTVYFVTGFPFVEDFLLTVKPKIAVNGAITKMDSFP